MSTESNKELVRHYLIDALAAVRSGDLNATDQFLTEDAAFHDPGRPPSIGREAQKERSRNLLATLPDVHFEIHDLVAMDDNVAARWTMRGTHKGNFGPIPPTNKTVEMTGMTIYRIVDDQIAEAHSDIDQLTMMQQLGAGSPLKGPR